MNISTSISIIIFHYQTLSLLVNRHFSCAFAHEYVQDDQIPGDQTSSKVLRKATVTAVELSRI